MATQGASNGTLSDPEPMSRDPNGRGGIDVDAVALMGQTPSGAERSLSSISHA